MAVKFSPEAVEKFGQLFKEFKTAPTQKLKTEMISIFAPQIELKAAEAAAKSGGKISAVDYAQDLYLKFLEKLDKMRRHNKYPAEALSKTMNKANPTAETFVTEGRKTVEELTPLEELDKLSYRFDEQTMLQKAKEIVNSSELVQAQSDVLSKSLEGYSFKEIGNEMGLTEERVKRIYNKAVKELKHPDKKIKMSRIFYDDLPLNGREPLTERDVKMILNRIIGNGCYAFNLDGVKLPKTFQQVKDDPRYSFLVWLPAHYDSPEFRKIAKKIAIEYYGRNVLNIAIRNA